MARILIIEDEELNREVFQALLESGGHQVVTTASGNEGLEYFRRESVDLVITDIFMPGKDGLETIQDLRTHDPNVVIVAVAASGLEVLQRALKLGASRVLEKPIARKILLDTVHELLAPKI
ncbi:MAG: response regulator [bacterium]|nr:response regulator [bacterium]